VDYLHTLVIVTSKGVEESKLRIWGSVKKYFSALPEELLSGGLMCLLEHPRPRIVTMKDGKKLDNAGIILVPADAAQNGDKTNKLHGVKAAKNKSAKSRMFLCGDEMTELSHALLKTMMNNLANAD